MEQTDRRKSQHVAGLDNEPSSSEVKVPPPSTAAELDAEKTTIERPAEMPQADVPVYVVGWRLHILSLSIAMCVFLVNIEVSIVGASLVSITDDLQGFRQMGWVVTGYLITYTSMIIIWAKLSDILGRKPVTMAAVIIFVAFSGGCGASQTMTQLIINRAFQGIGAAGCFSMALVIGYEMVPKEKYPALAAILSAATALGSLIGPLIGGGISERSTWRWVFLLNVPAGVVTIILLLICVPANFPHQGQASYIALTFRQRISRQSLSRLDVIGAVTLLGATLLLVTVLLEASHEFAWRSATAISLLVVSAELWILFLVNERVVTGDNWRPEPVFPWRFLFNRAWMGTLLLSLLSGVPYNIIIIDVPQRFQTVHGATPFGAGLRLIPFNFVIALSSALINVLAAKTRIPPVYLLFAGSVIQLVGLVLFSTLPDGLTAPSVIYGAEVLSGCGIGIMMGLLIIIPPHVVEARDLAISSGALLQFRVFGGVLGLAIASSVMNSHLNSSLSSSIGAERLSAVLESTAAIKGFPPNMQREVLGAFASGYNLQMKIMAGFAGLQVLTVGLLWRRKQISVTGKKDE